MGIVTDPISAVSEAVEHIADAVVALDPKVHPLMYRWKIWRLENEIISDCKKTKTLIPEDVVMSQCYELEQHEQFFIINYVREKLGMSPFTLVQFVNLFPTEVKVISSQTK